MTRFRFVRATLAAFASIGPWPHPLRSFPGAGLLEGGRGCTCSLPPPCASPTGWKARFGRDVASGFLQGRSSAFGSVLSGV
jgi:hypothetical protein